jgi:hypothetical protein
MITPNPLVKATANSAARYLKRSALSWQALAGKYTSYVVLFPDYLCLEE